MTTERRRPRRWAVLSACLLFASPSLSAADAVPSVSIRGEDSLALASHTSIPVLVALASGSADWPLTLTPRIEGAAVELVRGRLLRSDAKPMPTGAAHLRFDVPVVARSQGTAILRVELMTYACDPDCRSISVQDSRILRVR